MAAAVDELLRLLDIETLDIDLFRGVSRDDGFPQLYGGHVVGQALVAASRTVPARRGVQSLHAYFLRPGLVGQPIIYEVDRIRDGGSFTTRRVQAIQRGEAIFSMMASFHVAESGWEHAAPMPAVPAPEALRSGAELHREWLHGDRSEPPGLLAVQSAAERAGIEFRAVPGFETAPIPSQKLWFRCLGPLPDAEVIHACVLAYASDFCLLGTAKLPHGGYFGQPNAMVASLDHAVWLHRPVRADDWLLYSMDSPVAHSARGYTRGQIFDRGGNLVASVTQEGLMRRLRERAG